MHGGRLELTKTFSLFVICLLEKECTYFFFFTVERSNCGKCSHWAGQLFNLKFKDRLIIHGQLRVHVVTFRDRSGQYAGSWSRCSCLNKAENAMYVWGIARRQCYWYWHCCINQTTLCFRWGVFSVIIELRDWKKYVSKMFGEKYKGKLCRDNYFIRNSC